MGIAINVDKILLCSMFNINAQKLNTQYYGMSIDEIMKAEAASGNTAAANFDSSILNNPVKLIELFELKDPGNKFQILNNMSEHDLAELLPLLSQDDLIQGLQYFTKDKLLKLVEELPKEQLVKFVFDMFSPAQVMAMMPEDQLNKVLMSPNMDKNLELKFLQTLKPEIMAQIIEAVTGKPAAGMQDVGMDGKPHFDVKMLLEQLKSLPDDRFKEAMTSIPTANKQEFVYRMAQADPKIYLLFDADAYTNIINQKKDKQDLIRSASVIDNEQLVKMNQQLPKDLMSMVLTQIDTMVFAKQLISNFKNILTQIIAG